MKLPNDSRNALKSLTNRFVRDFCADHALQSESHLHERVRVSCPERLDHGQCPLEVGI